MQLGFNTMPIHPYYKDWRQCLREDHDAFVLADELGFAEGYVGEHATDVEENITSSMLFIASLARLTKQIRLGTGTINLPNHHPGALACQVALLDHLLDGRFILGIGPGGVPSDSELMGSYDKDRPAMLRESIEHILALWAGEAPHNLTGQFWNISTVKTTNPELHWGGVPKPLQRPHPPIVMPIASPFSQSAFHAGSRGWGMISANFLPQKWVKTHWAKYAEGCQHAGLSASPAAWRVARTIFVCDDERTARAYAQGQDGPYYRYYEAIYRKFKVLGRGVDAFKESKDEPDSAISPGSMCEKFVLCGSPSRVADQILALREDIGDFETLLYVGIDWQDRDLARNSMIKLAEKVLPLVEAAQSPRAGKVATAGRA